MALDLPASLFWLSLLLLLLVIDVPQSNADSPFCLRFITYFQVLDEVYESMVTIAFSLKVFLFPHLFLSFLPPSQLLPINKFVVCLDYIDDSLVVAILLHALAELVSSQPRRDLNLYRL